MKMRNILLRNLLLSLSLCFILSLVDATKVDQCGGTIDLNYGNLKYPDDDQILRPGQLCVWTIHLQSLTNFRLDFTRFNITDTGPTDVNCTKSGVKVYSLSNLQTGTEPDGYTFCEANPPSSTFLVEESVLAVIFYSDEATTNANSSFSLSWEGANVDVSRKKHVSTYMRTSSAAIRYPVIGGYEGNLVATWLVEPEMEVEVDILLRDIALEDCTFEPGSCYCDALFIYEVVRDPDQGTELKWASRICSSLNGSSTISGLRSPFIVALFTDLEDIDGVEGRIDLDYFPAQGGTTTTTSTTDLPTETTSEPIPTTPEICPIVTECSQIIEANCGRIEYKPDEYLPAHLRCGWIVRSRDSSAITFRLIEEGFYGSDDLIHLSGFTGAIPSDPGNSTNLEEEQMQTAGSVAKMNASVIHVLLGIYLAGSKGFILEFEGNLEGSNVSRTSRDYILQGDTGELSFPPETQTYGNREISLFYFPMQNDEQDGRAVNVTLIPKSSNGLPLEPECLDTVSFFNFHYYQEGLDFSVKKCYEDFTPNAEYRSPYLTVMAFMSDNRVTHDGFVIHWDWNWI